MTRRRVTLFAVLALAFSSWSPIASGQDVKQLKENGDVPGLMRLLRHRDGKVRSSASVALSRVIRQVDDSKALARHLLPLVDVTIRDPYLTVCEYAGRALKSALPRVREWDTMHTGAVTLARILQHKDVKRRRYAAVLLSWVVSRVTDTDTLRTISERVNAAAGKDSDNDVREYAGRAARDIGRRLQTAAEKAEK